MVRLAKAEKLSDFNEIFVSNMGVCRREHIPWSEREEKNKTKDYLKRSQVIEKKEREAVKETVKPDPVPEIKSEEPPKQTSAPEPMMREETVREKKSAGDNSLSALEKLNEKQRRVFDEMPLDRAVTVDYLAKTGIPFGEVISALTVLEIKGLVTSLPGALYIRK